MLKRLMLFAALIIAVTVLYPAGLQAQGVITIRVSYKVVLNPANGTRPFNPSTGAAVTDADLNAAITTMNTLSGPYLRGFRFQAVEIIDVGGLNDTTGPSRWFNTNFFDTTKVGSQQQGGVWKDQMEAAARSQAAYRWNNNAINIYITSGICGGKCSFAHESDNIVIIGACSAGDGALQLHEIGHYFNLNHTQGSTCGSCGTGTGNCNTPGDDGIADTLPDVACWTQDQIAGNAFGGKKYADLNVAQQNQVDDVFFNIMSYHPTLSRMTEQQLDLWTDTANSARANVCDGTTVFARVSNSYGSGSSSNPFGSLVVATAVASNRPGNNIVLLKPGDSTEAITINPPRGTTVTLRATRQGAVMIRP